MVMYLPDGLNFSHKHILGFGHPVHRKIRHRVQAVLGGSNSDHASFTETGRPWRRIAETP